mmetsp:Transcript_37374/g.93826  ORF Transcript_37374/g.93826 Transcript_37374/m.93826 type:complete len:322 (+) Transcript_37374:127-1092(+)
MVLAESSNFHALCSLEGGGQGERPLSASRDGDSSEDEDQGGVKWSTFPRLQESWVPAGPRVVELGGRVGDVAAGMQEVESESGEEEEGQQHDEGGQADTVGARQRPAVGAAHVPRRRWFGGAAQEEASASPAESSSGKGDPMGWFLGCLIDIGSRLDYSVAAAPSDGAATTQGDVQPSSRGVNAVAGSQMFPATPSGRIRFQDVGEESGQGEDSGRGMAGVSRRDAATARWTLLRQANRALVMQDSVALPSPETEGDRKRSVAAFGVLEAMQRAEPASPPTTCYKTKKSWLQRMEPRELDAEMNVARRVDHHTLVPRSGSM